ncbi:MAG: hypothetical protein JNK92_09420 [Dechloromonas sp.]|nr:hypothetical protein [Dechloromonas sp.]
MSSYKAAVLAATAGYRDVLWMRDGYAGSTASASSPPTSEATAEPRMAMPRSDAEDAPPGFGVRPLVARAEAQVARVVGALAAQLDRGA